MLPLDKNAVTTAAQLADDIEAGSSGTVTVVAVQQWNVAGQNYTTYLHEDNDVNFDVKLGYPYRVTVDVAAGNTSVTWPTR